jgi:tryptophan synthase alpha chain|tara:strand:- start:2063 stop:2872 length:810 start_codon:yes stop_codon:yes gene_type:complete
MSRLDVIFDAIRASPDPGLVTFITAGDPDLDRSAEILRALNSAGSDVLEIGVPFSDPLADGPVIQRASERALQSGTTLSRTIAMVEQVRPKVEAGIVLFTYANPVVRMGQKVFLERAANAGVDGVLILDLPIEEAEEFHTTAKNVGVDPIFLLSPTTSDVRIKRAADLGQGFLYGISRLGVTGAQDTLSDGAEALVARIRRLTNMPIALGFGISRPEHVSEVGQWADAAVVGSGLVDVIARASSEGLLADVERYVKWLRGKSSGSMSVG